MDEPGSHILPRGGAPQVPSPSGSCSTAGQSAPPFRHLTSASPAGARLGEGKRAGAVPTPPDRSRDPATRETDALTPERKFFVTPPPGAGLPGSPAAAVGIARSPNRPEKAAGRAEDPAP